MTLFAEALLETLRAAPPCTVATVLETRGSTPRKPGAKMLIREDGSTEGTVGSGKFEALIIALAKEALGNGVLQLKTFPLHECDEESFGAICDGEVTVLAALRSLLTRSPIPQPAYLGMIGSLRKVSMVMENMEAEGIPKQALKTIYCLIGPTAKNRSPDEVVNRVACSDCRRGCFRTSE